MTSNLKETTIFCAKKWKKGLRTQNTLYFGNSRVRASEDPDAPPTLCATGAHATPTPPLCTAAHLHVIGEYTGDLYAPPTRPLCHHGLCQLAPHCWPAHR